MQNIYLIISSTNPSQVDRSDLFMKLLRSSAINNVMGRESSGNWFLN
jgi:hypothetical protein